MKELPIRTDFGIDMSLYSLPSLGACLALCFLLFFIFKKGGKTPAGRVLYFLIIHWLLYAIGEFLLINTASQSLALIFDKIVYFAAALIISNYLHLSFIYPKPFAFVALRPYLLGLLYLPAIFLITTLPTDYFIAGVQPSYWGWGKVEGPLYHFFRMYLLLYFLGAILTIFIRRRYAGPAARNGLTMLGLAYFGPIIIGITITQILQPMGYDKFNIMAVPVSMVLFSCVIAYAITRQHLLFDMQLLLAPAIKTKKYRFHQQIKALIRQIQGQNLDYSRIVTMLQDTLKCAVGLNINGQPVAACGADTVFAQAKLTELDRQIESLSVQDDMLGSEVRLICRATFADFDTLFGHLEARGIEAVLPLYDDGRILGTLKFGKGFSEKIYSKQDYQLISTLCSQLVVALKYIRKLEEQLAVKDRVITKLKRKIQFMQSDFRSMVTRCDSQPASIASAVWISGRRDCPPSIDGCAHYPSLRKALAENPSPVVILDGRGLSGAIRKEVKRLRSPLVIVGPAQNLPTIENNRLIDTVPEGKEEERLKPAVSFLSTLQQAIRFHVNGIDFVTNCTKLLTILDRVQQIAPKAKAILLNGETGTGKELIAAHIGQVCKKEMVHVNCAAISEGLFESAFFGHEKGAFTGADRRHKGYLEQAHRGLLFLDEISELPLDMQAKLLRIIDGEAFQRVGGQSFIQPRVQFVFASNSDLKALAAQGGFRNDLLYRLDQLSFELPPLRERKDDIPLLAGYYLLRHKRRFHVDVHISAAVMATHKANPWPGNVRQLSNAILKWVIDAQNQSTGQVQDASATLPEKVRHLETALIQLSLSTHGSKRKAAEKLGIPVSTLRSKLKKMDLHQPIPSIDIDLDAGSELSLTGHINQFERSLIDACLRRSDSQSEAARALGVPLSTLRSKLKKHNLTHPGAMDPT